MLADVEASPLEGPRPGARFVCATAGSHRVAFAIAEVQEVLAPRAVTRLFHAPRALLGVLNLRGDILPVVELAQLLGAAPQRGLMSEPNARLVVVRAKVSIPGAVTKVGTLALLVTHLDPLRDADQGELRPIPAGVPDIASRLAIGVVDADGRPVMVMDVARIVATDELASMRT
jgi:purine-binding chemotaxis protein CheW